MHIEETGYTYMDNRHVAFAPYRVTDPEDPGFADLQWYNFHFCS